MTSALAAYTGIGHGGISRKPGTKARSDISRAQVARFIRRMALVSEGDARLVRVLEDADGVGLSVPVPKPTDR